MGWVVKYKSHFFPGTKTDGIFVKKSTAEFWQICVSLSPCTIEVWIEEVSEERKGD